MLDVSKDVPASISPDSLLAVSRGMILGPVHASGETKMLESEFSFQSTKL